MDWFKRSRRDETQCADRRTWRTRCGHYKVIETDIKFGRGLNRRGEPRGYPIYYLAMALTEVGWKILSTHRKRKIAVSQCEYFHQHGHLMPKKTKSEKAKKRQKAKRQARKEQRNVE